MPAPNTFAAAEGAVNGDMPSRPDAATVRPAPLTDTPSSPPAARGGVRRAALLTVGSTGISSLLGIVNFMVMARLLGASRPVDAYLVAMTMPNLVGVAFGRLLSTYMVPWLIALRHKCGSDEARRIQIRLLVICPLVSLLLLCVCYRWNTQLTNLLAPGFKDVGSQALVVSLMKWTFAGGVCVMFLSILTSIAHSHERFGGMALASLLNPATTLVLLLACGKTWGVTALAVGFLLGPLLGCIPVLASLRGVWYEDTAASTTVANGTSPEGVTTFAGLFFLALITTLHMQLPLVVGRYLASSLGAGVIAGLSYAAQFAGMPIMILANSVGNALLPTLAKRHQAVQDGFSPDTLRDVTKAIRVVAYVLVPLATLLLFFSFSVIGVAFASGARNFTGHDVVLTAQLIAGYTPAIWIGATWMVLIKLVQARHENRALVEALVVGVTTDVCLAVTLTPLLGYLAIPIANSANCTIATLWLLFRTRRTIPLPLREIGRSMAVLTALSLCAAGAVFAVREHTPWWITAPVYAGTYIGLAIIFKVKERAEFWSLILGSSLQRLRMVKRSS